jgi:hypothetical protein
MIDVVTVPDFSGQAARTFEARTLLFLASWMANAGKARSWPLHLACIGQPPAAVRCLAEACGAHVTMHKPVRPQGPKLLNKLRGLELAFKTEKVLLLDTDVFVLGDPSGLDELGLTLAAAPGIKPRIPNSYWPRIYAELGLEPPAARIACVLGELGCGPLSRPTFPGQFAEFNAMFPYYNSGVLLAPVGCRLRSLWEEYRDRIAAMFTPSDPIWEGVGRCDQAAFSALLVAMQRQGWTFTRLPAPYHGHRFHLFAGAPAPTEIKLFHGFRMFKHPWLGLDLVDHLSIQLHRFWLETWRSILGEWRRAGCKPRNFHIRRWTAKVVTLDRLTQGLVRDYISPAIQGRAPQGWPVQAQQKGEVRG